MSVTRTTIELHTCNVCNQAVESGFGYVEFDDLTYETFTVCETCIVSTPENALTKIAVELDPSNYELVSEVKEKVMMTLIDSMTKEDDTVDYRHLINLIGRISNGS